MRATEYAPRGRYRLLERIYGLAEIGERGAGVLERGPDLRRRSYFEGRLRRLGCCGHDVPSGRRPRVRLAFVWLVEQRWLEFVTLVVIIVNSLVLAVQGPPDSPDSLLPKPLSDALEFLFTVLFTIEMVSKMLAMGVAFHAGSYVRDPWNLLDMTVVLSAWAPLLFPSLNNVSAIRSLRALRPLRSINQMPGLRKQAMTLIDSVPKMQDVAVPKS